MACKLSSVRKPSFSVDLRTSPLKVAWQLGDSRGQYRSRSQSLKERSMTSVPKSLASRGSWTLAGPYSFKPESSGTRLYFYAGGCLLAVLSK